MCKNYLWLFKYAAFLDPKTVSFLDKKELASCTQLIKQMYPSSKSTPRNNRENSLPNSQNLLDGGLSAFAINAGTK